MNQRKPSTSWWRATAVAALTCLVSFTASAQLPSRANILSTVSLVNNYWTANNTASSITNDWNGAVYMIGDMAAYDATANSNYLNYAVSWANAHGYGINGGNANRNANCQAAGEIYIRLYQLLGDSSKLANITSDVHAMVAGTSSSDWTWCDTLNMAMRTWAELGQIYQDPAYASRMHDFYNYAKTAVGGPGLYNPTLHLWYRDASYISPPVYWSRGNAWVFVAHAKVLQTLPASDPHYAEYLSTFQNMAAELITLQQSDGFWYANLTNPSQYPTPETSGTAGFTYGLAWGVRTGVLNSATYLPHVISAWNGMVATAVHANGFLGYVQGTGSNPGSDQPVTSSNTADFGVGLFLEAGYQVAQLASAQVAVPTYKPAGGIYSTGQSVTISSATSGATIRYTTDGSTPSSTVGTLYAGAVAINATTTLKAIAYASGLSDSFVSSDTYTINQTGVAAPVFSPSAGTYGSPQSVTISTITGGASIRYTTNGSTPTSTTGTLYSGSISISSTTTLKAIAFKSGSADSPVTTGTYTIGAAGGFSISASPSSQTVPLGSNPVSYTATVSAPNGFTGTVSLSVSGLPSQASGRFNPTSVTGSGTSILTVTIGKKSRAGTYPLTLTGTSGTSSHSTTVTLVIQ